MKKILLKALPLVLLFVSAAIRAELHPIRRNRVQKTGIRFLADIRRRNTLYAQGCSLFFRERRTTSAPGASCIHFGSGNSDKDIGLRRQACRERSLRSPRLLERCKQLLFPLPSVTGCRIHQAVQIEIAARLFAGAVSWRACTAAGANSQRPFKHP